MAKKSLLTESQIQAITDAVAQAESHTSGQIVPVILRRSDNYPGARWRWAIAFTGFCAFALIEFHPWLRPIWYLWAQVPALALGYASGSIPWVLRNFLARDEMEKETHQRALEAFHIHHLQDTKDRTGVLVFVSMVEHRAIILADTGIHSRVPDGSWDAIVSRLVARLGQGELSEGLCAAIRECGDLLAGPFPHRPGSRNELPDRPQID